MRQYASYPDLKDQCVVVTGGGSGIGAGMVNAFALQGARVFYIDLVDEHVHAAYDGHAPTFVRCDLTDTGALQSAFRRIADGRSAWSASIGALNARACWSSLGCPIGRGMRPRASCVSICKRRMGSRPYA